MSAPRAIIADDEASLRQYLRHQLRSAWPELTICGEAASGPEARELLATERPDVAFLDIKMPGSTGLEVASCAAPNCHIVFITAFDRFAVEAFEKAAVDYLLKPVTDERLRVTVARLRDKLAYDPRPSDHLAEVLRNVAEMVRSSENRTRLQWLKASQGDRIQLVHVDDVRFFRASDKYTLVVTKNDELVIRMSIKQLIKELDSEKFWQIHRSIIVNAQYVTLIERGAGGRYEVHLKDRSERLRSSRSFSAIFKQM